MFFEKLKFFNVPGQSKYFNKRVGGGDIYGETSQNMENIGCGSFRNFTVNDYICLLGIEQNNYDNRVSLSFHMFSLSLHYCLWIN